jgi:SpoVK/Ycf46/Vps4 family AAA+-type ATPase
VEVPRPEFAERVRLWTAALNGDGSRDPSLDAEALANKFRFTGGEIAEAAATARNLARSRGPTDGALTMADLYAACRMHSNPRLAALARKVTPRYAWDDIVLPPDRVQQLREITNYVKYRARVYGDWGFDRKLAMGKGLNALFAGPSGTGKTMAAEIIAGELALDLFKVDLSTVVSKYIGETEKNLSRIFTEAETSNSILFFDEADSMFGRRSEVRDSHDRYANLEISYLLQRMEEYEGVVILATNFRKNMDDAFVRRLHFAVDFPFPGERERLRIWQRVWPERTPRAPDLDLEQVARRVEVAGGSIRNIALAAAFLAADEEGVVGMGHLLRATRREYQKMGKVLSDGDLGELARVGGAT